MQDLFRFITNEFRGAWRYRWYALAAAWSLCFIGWLIVLRLPDIYEARAQVFVDAESRLAEVMGQVGVSPGVGSQVFVVRQALLGRPQLEYTASKTGLDRRATTLEEREELIAGLRERIVVATGRSGEGKKLFTISFQDADRQMSLAVVESLLETFVNDVLKLKDAGAEQATGYLEDQLAYYAGLLSDAERRLAEFKKQNVGLLPGESGGIFERLQLQLETLKETESELRVELDRQAELRRQLTSEDPYLPENATGAGGTPLPGTPSEQAIRDLESQRNQMLLSFTERHPDVIAITEQLEQLYGKQKEERAALAQSGSGIEGVANSSNPVYQGVQIALNESSVKIATLRSQVAQIRSVVNELSTQIDTIPAVEAEYAELTRDYSQYRALYNELLERRERERLSTAGDERDVVTFNITEPPAVGLEPVAPLRGLLIVAVLILALGIGGFLAWVVHQLNPIFQDARSLRDYAQRPVLGVVSMTWLERDQNQRRVKSVSFATASVLLIVTCGLLIVFKDQLAPVMGALFQDSATQA